MAHSVSTKPELAVVTAQHPQQIDPTTLSTSSPETAFGLQDTLLESQHFKHYRCVRPFDRWRPVGGGAECDIFRRFKILTAEEEAFLVHWARMSSDRGILSRDETGTLIFRISSKNLSDLNKLRIGRSDRPDLETEWLHVYDEEGVSWLTQFACTEPVQFPTAMYDSIGRPLLANGRIGRYGPSGVTVSGFFLQYHRKSSMI
jgi:hypothetical protein